MKPAGRFTPTTRRRPTLWPALLTLAVPALLLALLVLIHLRARYGWRDLYGAFGVVAALLSRRRLAGALLVSAVALWLAARWRSKLHLTFPVLGCYLAGVLADAAVLLLLPVMGISYGPVLLPLTLLTAIRCLYALGLEFVALLFRRTGRDWRLWPALHVAGQALMLLLVVDAFVVEPARLTVSHVPVADPYWAEAGGRAIRIVQLSDLHVERANSLTWRMVEETNRLEPDIIVLTGDYVNTSFTGDPQAFVHLRRLVGALHARNGIYAIRGSVDPADLSVVFGDLPVITLKDRWTTVEVNGRGLVLAGVAVHQGAFRGVDRSGERQALADILTTMPRDAFSVLLYHSPDLVPEAVDAGINLVLTGHTHGGQIRLPFYGALTTFSLYGKRWEMGLYREQGTLIYVSRGIGLEGWTVPRVRLLCPPEVVCYDIGS